MEEVFLNGITFPLNIYIWAVAYPENFLQKQNNFQNQAKQNIRGKIFIFWGPGSPSYATMGVTG